VANPALSRGASVRLPWPCFRRPPYDPGQRVFPSPVLTLAIPSPPAHRVRNAAADSDHALHSRGLRSKLVPQLRTRPPQFRAWDRFGTAKCPESLRPPRALPPAGSCLATPRPALPDRPRYYELMRQSSPLTTASVCKPCAAGLCRLQSAPAGMSTFPTLSLQSLLRRLDPYPAAFLGCIYPFLPQGHRPHVRNDTFGTLEESLQSNFSRGGISGLQSFTHVQAPQLAWPPGCAHRTTSVCRGRPGRIHHAKPRPLPVRGCGIATCLKTGNWHGGTCTRWIAALSATPVSRPPHTPPLLSHFRSGSHGRLSYK
jgi:hypothetical protein